VCTQTEADFLCGKLQGNFGGNFYPKMLGLFGIFRGKSFVNIVATINS
jgi:hypothetical protein